MVEPTGVPARIATTMPISEQITDMVAAATVTEKKLLNTRMAESAGNTTRADTRSAPTRFMASTIIVATMTAISRLKSAVLTPVARANSRRT